MAFKEVYGALQTKIVDGQENTWSNIYGRKFFEVQNRVTETNHGIIDYLVVTSREWWDGLEPGLRKQLASILEKTTKERNRLSHEVNQQARKKTLDANGVIRTLNAQQRAAWIKAMKPVWSQL